MIILPEEEAEAEAATTAHAQPRGGGSARPGRSTILLPRPLPRPAVVRGRCEGGDDERTTPPEEAPGGSEEPPAAASSEAGVGVVFRHRPAVLATMVTVVATVVANR